MSKWNDCQINSCLTPSLLPLSPYVEALHGSSTDIKGKTAHVIGAGAWSACQTLLSLASSTWSTYYFSQCGLADDRWRGLGNWCVFSLVNWILKEALFTQEPIMNSLPMWLQCNHNIQPHLKMTSKSRQRQWQVYSNMHKQTTIN